MWEDTIVEEVHAIRAQLLARFGGDLHQYCEYVRTHPAPHTPSAETSAADVPTRGVAAVISHPPATGLR
jgi:hypothetical protein